MEGYVSIKAGPTPKAKLRGKVFALVCILTAVGVYIYIIKR